MKRATPLRDLQNQASAAILQPSLRSSLLRYRHIAVSAART